MSVADRQDSADEFSAYRMQPGHFPMLSRADQCGMNCYIKGGGIVSIFLTIDSRSTMLLASHICCASVNQS